MPSPRAALDVDAGMPLLESRGALLDSGSPGWSCPDPEEVPSEGLPGYEEAGGLEEGPIASSRDLVVVSGRLESVEKGGLAPGGGPGPSDMDDLDAMIASLTSDIKCVSLVAAV